MRTMNTIHVDRHDKVKATHKRHAYEKNGNTMIRLCGVSRTIGNLVDPHETKEADPCEFAGRNDACQNCVEALGVEPVKSTSARDVNVNVEALLSDSSDSSVAEVSWSDVSGPAEEEDETDWLIPLDDEPDVEEDPVPQTISFEPNWDWLGLQLAKLGLPVMARRAFNEEMSPAEVYGGGVEQMLVDKYHNGADHLDLGYPNGRHSLIETAADPEEVAYVKQELGIVEEATA